MCVAGMAIDIASLHMSRPVRRHAMEAQEAMIQQVQQLAAQAVGPPGVTSIM